MFTQTIGVEVEMAGITRDKAARIASIVFETHRYQHLGDGYDTYVAYDAEGREWKFSKDISISAPSNFQCEMITPILRYDDIPLLQEVIRTLRKNGATSYPNKKCGIHIHIGADGHTPQSLRTLSNIMASHEYLLLDAINVDNERRGYCEITNPHFLERLNKEKPSTMEALRDVWYEGNGASYNRTAHYNNSRYHMLNLHATFTKGTIEFRLFQFDNPGELEGKKGGLHAGRLKAFIQLCLALSHKAKTQKFARGNTRMVAFENPRFAMRTWMNQLGMIGDEFKTARKLLIERLKGDSAWRYGKNDPKYKQAVA